MRALGGLDLGGHVVEQEVDPVHVGEPELLGEVAEPGEPESFLFWPHDLRPSARRAQAATASAADPARTHRRSG